MSETFDPHPLLRGPHRQTLAARFLRPETGVAFRREQWETPDGDAVEVDFADVPGAEWSTLGDEAPIGLLLHGLEGCARTSYAHQSYKEFAAVGIRPVGLNFRTCGGRPPSLPRAYHAGETTDPRMVVERLRDRFPDAPLVAIGFSLGGNVLLKMLGEWGESTPISAAVSVSAPFDLGRCVQRIESGFSRVYSAYLRRRLQSKLALRRDELREHANVDGALQARTLRGFDEHLTAPLHGFEGADDYYRRSSSTGFLEHIAVPTLLLRSTDDPFLAEDDIPHDVIAGNPALEPRFSLRGGHVAFVGRRAEGGLTYWAEETAARWLAGVVRGR
ncbi:MAG: alpha/beta fold hydrolase [Deltaproteobacteria bacterium]|nr:alpha/beta fold hydrolase [Deltaproteobacteria bacterium]